jgi:hypothetical protein
MNREGKMMMAVLMLMIAKLSWAADGYRRPAQQNPSAQKREVFLRSSDASKKLEFDDQSINALDPDYGKLDLSSIKDDTTLSGRVYPIRRDMRKEQNHQIRFWGVGE